MDYKLGRIHPLTMADSQIHFIITGVNRGWFSKQEAKKALKKIRDEKVIRDNMYQARSVT